MYSIKTVSEPVKIALNSDVMKLKADEKDIAIIEVQLLDKNNNKVIMANNIIHFDIYGEGKIIGVDNGDQACTDNFKLPQRNAYNGRCIVIVQTTNKKGSLKLIAKSDGLPETSLEIVSE